MDHPGGRAPNLRGCWCAHPRRASMPRQDRARGLPGVPTLPHPSPRLWHLLRAAVDAAGSTAAAGSGAGVAGGAAIGLGAMSMPGGWSGGGVTDPCDSILWVSPEGSRRAATRGSGGHSKESAGGQGGKRWA